MGRAAFSSNHSAVNQLDVRRIITVISTGRDNQKIQELPRKRAGDVERTARFDWRVEYGAFGRCMHKYLGSESSMMYDGTYAAAKNRRQQIGMRGGRATEHSSVQADFLRKGSSRLSLRVELATEISPEAFGPRSSRINP